MRFKIPDFSKMILALIGALIILTLSGYLPDLFFGDHSVRDFNPDKEIVLGRV